MKHDSAVQSKYNITQRPGTREYFSHDYMKVQMQSPMLSLFLRPT